MYQANHVVFISTIFHNCRILFTYMYLPFLNSESGEIVSVNEEGLKSAIFTACHSFDWFQEEGNPIYRKDQAFFLTVIESTSAQP